MYYLIFVVIRILPF